MTDTRALQDLTQFGLQPSFVDSFGVVQHPTEAGIDAVSAVFEGTSSSDPKDALLIVTSGEAHQELVGELYGDDGRTWLLEGRLPREIPYGYYRLYGDEDTDRLVIVTPEKAGQPEQGWGFSVQLYAARSKNSWGIGDFGDLAEIARRATEEGASSILISPTHATRPGPQQDSPYHPASRLFTNLCHVDASNIIGAENVDVSDLALEGQALNSEELIDRSRIYALKVAALERAWTACEGQPGAEYEAYVSERGAELHSFSVWSVLAETFDGPWWSWPAEYDNPDSYEVSRFAEEQAGRVRFWSYCQWVADVQFQEACSQGVDIVSDLAVGFDPGGADGWVYQDLVASGFEVGCPADRGNPDGQRWGVAPFDPNRLTAADYAPYRAMFKAALRHAQGLRVDHVMGLWRLYWIPVEGDVDDGVYIRYPGEALLSVLKVEADRKGAWVVGEDMGTLEEGALDALAASGVLSYRVSMRTHPNEFPEQAMVACQTHDQATVAGVVDRSDVAVCQRIGKAVNVEAREELRVRICRLAGVDYETEVGRDDIGKAVVAMYRELAGCRSRLALATFDDLAGVSQRPNIPSSGEAWPNWRIPLPYTIDELFASPLAREVIYVMRQHRGQSGG